MVLTYPMNSYFNQGPLSVDTSSHISQRYFEEDDNILDDSVLNHSAIDSGLEMSPHMLDSRRDSFSLGSSLFSPKQEDWQPSEMHSLSSGNPFASTNPFMRIDHQHRSQPQTGQQHSTMGAPLSSWPMTASTSAASAGATPVVQYDGMSSDYESGASVFQRGSLQPPFPMSGLFSSAHHGMADVPSTPNVANTSVSSVPMQLSASSGSVDTQSAAPKKLPPQSPMTRSHNEMRRGDGIRKKNARFEIPAERNLNNIDQLISQSTDEQEIKELKQQKRLLRNRQAALDSRQRKKQHTERLEDEKKHYTVVMADMEQAIERLKLQVTELVQEKQSYDQYIESLNMEKEDMIRQHTIETAKLRKKIGVLTNHVRVLEGSAAAAVMPNGAAYASAGACAAAGMGHFGDMEGLSMEATPDTWDHLFPGMVNADQQHHQHVADVKSDMQLAPYHKATANEAVESALVSTEKSATQGGLLFMLFLVGAFVLSSRQTPSIPRVSEDVRVASAALLENVLKDAGVPQDTPGLDVTSTAAVASSSVNTNVPEASGAAWSQPAGQSIGIEPSVLGQLSDQLMQPTEEQANEQLFSLTAAQYNGVVSYQQPPTPDHSESSGPANQGRRNLAEALAAMRGNSKAEVYTRSLLWDQIPSDVVRTFAKMVSEVNTASPAADGDS